MRMQYLAGLSLALTPGAALAAAAQTTTPAHAGPISGCSIAGARLQPGRIAGVPPPLAPSLIFLFRGVNLTQDERTKLSSIRDQYRTQFKPLVQQIRTARHAIRTAAAKADTAAVNAARATLRDVRSTFTTTRTKWMSDARAVLTPDQQAQFAQRTWRGCRAAKPRANRKTQS